MGKTKICSADQIVYAASAAAFSNLGSSDSPTLQFLLERPTTGLIPLYKQGSCKCCDSKCNAKVFAAAINALATINYFILPEYLQIPATDSIVPPAFLAYLTLIELVQLYVNNKCKCKNSKLKKQYEKIFTEAFNTIATEGAVETTVITDGNTVITITLNINLITATAHYVAANINCENIPITNVPTGGTLLVGGVPN